MKPEEAIEVLSNELIVITDMIGYCRDFEKESDLALAYRVKRQDAYKIAITALREIQQYRAIGTVEECREAMEKQRPKKTIPINYQDYADKIDNAEFFEGSYFCPNCGTVLRSGSYCNRCGQKLGWNENLEGMEDENT